MAVKLEFFNIIVPLENIRRVQANLIEMNRMILRKDITEALKHTEPVQIGVCWHDGVLFRHGAMDWGEIEEMFDQWQRCGLQPTENVAGEKRWKDLCAAVSGQGIVQFPCAWAVYNASENSISAKRT